MDTNTLGVLECVDKDEMVGGDKYVLACLDKGVLECLDNNDTDYFDVDFLHTHLFE